MAMIVILHLFMPLFTISSEIFRKNYLGKAKLITLTIAYLLLWNLSFAQTYYLFVGSYNFSNEKEGIYVYKFDTVTGKLKKVSSTHNIANPSYLTPSPNGRYVYACTESQTKNAGSVSSFEFDSTKGILTFINRQPSGGENPVYLSVDKSGRLLVNANYTEGSISVYPLRDDGSINAASQVISFFDGSINKERQQRSHIHSAIFSPTQNFVFFPDLGADKIRCYSFDPFKGQPLSIAENPFVKTVSGSGPRHFTFHPNGRFAYCIEEMAGYITAYKYGNGRLDSIQRIAAHGKEHAGDFSSADIHISADGRFLYASNRADENNLAIYAVNEHTGILKLVGYQSVSGDHPRNFTIDPTGKFLLVANQISGDVIVFKRNINTGLLTKTGVQIKLLNPSCLQIRKYMVNEKKV